MVENGSCICSAVLVLYNDGCKLVNCCHVTVAWPAIGQLIIKVRALI